MHVEQQSQSSEHPSETTDAHIEETQALAGLYGLVARCLEDEIDPELLRFMRKELSEPLADAGWVLDEDFLNGAESEILEALAEEFTGLLVAPGCVSPYASVFETGCMYREPCDQAVAAYRKAGWDYQRRLSGEFPDHVGTLLGFLGQLAAAEAEAMQGGDHDSAALARQHRNSFLLEQVGPWVPGWCQRAAQATLLPFYRQLVQFTEQLIWSELTVLTDRRGLKEFVALNQREPKNLDYDADFRKASGL